MHREVAMLALLALACAAPEESAPEDTYEESDADTDTDIDADTDADTGVLDPDPVGLIGNWDLWQCPCWEQPVNADCTAAWAWVGPAGYEGVVGERLEVRGDGTATRTTAVLVDDATGEVAFRAVEHVWTHGPDGYAVDGLAWEVVPMGADRSVLCGAGSHLMAPR